MTANTTQNNSETQFIQLKDWKLFIDYASEKARSFPAKERVSLLCDSMEHWSQSAEEANLWQAETTECLSFLNAPFFSDLFELDGIDSIIEHLRKQGILKLHDAVLILRWLQSMESLQEYSETDNASNVFVQSSLNQIASQKTPFSPIRKAFSKVIDPSGNIREDASSKLKSIYSSIRAIEASIQTKMESLANSLSEQGLLQEKFTDRHDGRYVLPVKVASQGKVPGMVYGASSSRKTVFIEPRAIEALNNQLQTLEIEKNDEIFRLLAELSKSIRNSIDDFQETYELLVKWDVVQARAQIAKHYQAIPINVTKSRSISMNGFSHPLLWWSLDEEEIISNDFQMESPHQVLLISGPNTGGKTVICEGIVMAALASRAGFLLPGLGAKDRKHQVPFFKKIYIDLGDHQDIEQSLSSFSGRVLYFKKILENADEQTLVFLDELNSATDPIEGAALSRSILEELCDLGATVLVTTHDPSLKTLAQEEKRILNAAMAFDEEASKPTFRLRLGTPGRSRAIETAERLGISKNIIERARSFLDEKHFSLDQLTRELENKINEAEKERKEAVKIKKQAQNLENQWKERLSEGLRQAVETAEVKLRKTISQAQEEAKSLLDHYQGKENKSSVGSNPIKQLSRSLSQKLGEIRRGLDVDSETTKDTIDFDVESLQEGDFVHYESWKKDAKVTQIKKTKVQIQLEGGFGGTLWAKKEDLLPPKKKSRQKQSKPPAHSSLDTSPMPHSTLDLRGKRYEAAMQELRTYLDQAFSSGLKEVKIIHGVGTGALREGTKKLLSDIPYIEESFDASADMGGTGCTIVRF